MLSSQFALARCDGYSESFTITDPQDGSDFEATAKIYRPSSKKFPIIFILPPIVGETLIDRKMAMKFCSNGLGSYILNVVKKNTQEEEIKNFKVHDYSYLRALEAVRTIRKELNNDPSTNGNYGIMGVSLGGMLAAYVAGVERDFKAGVFVVAAGNVPSVLAYSEQELVKAQRNQRKKFFNISNDASYEALLREAVTQDPLNVIVNVIPESTYFFISKDDTTVPGSNQIELATKAPSPLVYMMRGKHLSGIIKAGTIHSGKILRFFKRRLFNSSISRRF